ncbi:MAG: hypothetical protein KJ757_03350 [Planctomycetes bacterium]|nr:hypothetical protein [Planctomycetota bacterium]MBU1518285.1 hypothetical protein [Planctomycetota bacterium]MBU2458169.1 hypothetical protein [Planctomycetota bacterium]MBU2596585.1 hypothetical protein [Planctomycetota bacterium]
MKALSKLCSQKSIKGETKCLETGSSKEQILEAASVAVVMGGGPAYMYVIEVMDALEALGQ